jgi:hypothetical protein
MPLWGKLDLRNVLYGVVKANDLNNTCDDLLGVQVEACVSAILSERGFLSTILSRLIS